MFPGSQFSGRVGAVPFGGGGAVNTAFSQSGWRFDVVPATQAVTVTPPGGSGAPGFNPGLQRSVLAGDVVSVSVIPGTFVVTGVGLGGAPPGKVLVKFDIRITNLLTGANLITPTFPVPPGPGIFLFPYSIRPTVTIGVNPNGTDIVVELLNTGQVVPGADFDGPPYHWVTGGGCVLGTSNCYRYESFTAPLLAGGATASRTIGFELDPSVNNFRAKLVLAADLQNVGPAAGR